jgi:hypothetical protein
MLSCLVFVWFGLLGVEFFEFVGYLGCLYLLFKYHLIVLITKIVFDKFLK